MVVEQVYYIKLLNLCQYILCVYFFIHFSAIAHNVPVVTDGTGKINPYIIRIYKNRVTFLYHQSTKTNPSLLWRRNQ